MSSDCGQCEAFIKNIEKRCDRLASCRQGCWQFCWQHAKMHEEGRAEGTWEKGKGCTGKKLYEYRKKSGPKTGKCNSKTMIGASGKCVKRTPVNLAKKKEALARRKSGGKKKTAIAPVNLMDMLEMETIGCPEGQSWNMRTGVCECPEGHRWDEELEKCIESEYERVGFPEEEEEFLI